MQSKRRKLPNRYLNAEVPARMHRVIYCDSCRFAYSDLREPGVCSECKLEALAVRAIRLQINTGCCFGWILPRSFYECSKIG